MYWYMENPQTLILLFISIIITIAAQSLVKRAYEKYKKIKSKSKLTGFEAARKILDQHGLKDVHVVTTTGILSDHYDPKRKVVRLSKEIFDGDSIASISIAAHEVGHALQDKEGYILMKLRGFIVPVVNLSSKIGYFAILIGFFTSMTEFLWFGIYLLIGTVIFQLITLPVEFDASKKARDNLAKLIPNTEQEFCKKMLRAAAMTYVAGLATTLLQLLRLVLMAKRRG